ncbi:MAG: hypothetical protein R3315_03800, partial [Woeseiaceae bacterium]|nr:hypothetical protein [Woeseiaceae bacterium]
MRSATTVRITGLGIVLALCTASADDRHELSIVPTAATAAVQPGQAGRRTIELPDLSYSFQLRPRCRPPYEPQSLSLTVADSHRFFRPVVTSDTAPVVRTTLPVSSGQIAPIAIEGFCVADDQPAASEDRPQTVASVLTAAASLRCASDDSEAIVYTS